MTVPADVAVTGLSELAVRARTDAGQVNTVPPAPGRSLAQILRANVLTRFNAILGTLFIVVLIIGAPRARPGFTRRVLSFTIPAGTAVATAALASYAIARGADGAGLGSRTAAMLAAFAVGLWVVALVAGRPTASRVFLVAVMAAGLVPLFALPPASRILALALPSPWVMVAVAVVVLAAIAALTLWWRYGRLR